MISPIAWACSASVRMPSAVASTWPLSRSSAAIEPSIARPAGLADLEVPLGGVADVAGPLGGLGGGLGDLVDGGDGLGDGGGLLLHPGGLLGRARRGSAPSPRRAGRRPADAPRIASARPGSRLGSARTMWSATPRPSG